MVSSPVDAPNDAAGSPRFSRRRFLTSAAGVGVAVAAWRRGGARLPAAAARSSTRAWRVAVDDDAGVSAAEAGGYRVLAAEFPFGGLGASWPGPIGTGPMLEVSFSADGESFTAPRLARATPEYQSPANRDGRVFTQLVFTRDSSFIRFRTLDEAGNPVPVPGLELVYIDASDGPRADGAIHAAEVLAMEKPPVVSRAAWGADESWRFTADGAEISPRVYRTVEHVIVHHTDTLNDQDPYVAIRIIYEYHAIDFAWGDIGYNYLVGQDGTIFEGRAGGDDVVGHHSYEYAEGSSGITCIGTYETASITAATRASLVAIVAWVARNLDPLGRSDFHSTSGLPTICGHRDVGDTTCPGDNLYGQLPALRQSVADVIATAKRTPGAGETLEFSTGANVVVVGATMLRALPAAGATVLRRVNAGTMAAVLRGARAADGRVWYAIHLETSEYGYVLGKYLDPAPAGDPPQPVLERSDRVVPLRSPLRLRANPGIAQEVPAVVNAGVVALVVEGPVAATGQQWYRIAAAGGASGWVMQSEVKLARARKVSLSITAGPPNKLLTATLRGFPIGQDIAVLAGGVVMGTVHTDKYGGGALAFRVPYLPMGATPIRGELGYAAASASYDIRPRLSVAPSAAPAGVAAAAYLTGCPANGTATLQAQVGGAWGDLAAGATDATGRAKLAFVVPAAPVGRLPLRAVCGAASVSVSFGVAASAAAFTPTPDPTPTPEPAATATPSPAPSPVEQPPVATATPEPTQPPTATPEPTAPPTEPPPEPSPPEPASATPEPTPEGVAPEG